MKNEQYMRKCPRCDKEIYHKTKHILNQSIKDGRICKKFVNSSDERNEKISKSSTIERIKRYSIKQNRDIQSQAIINRYKRQEERKKSSDKLKLAWKDPIKRKKFINTCRWNNISCDKGQVEMITKWNNLGFNFEINFIIKDEQNLFYLDGYDKDRNIVFEYDSKNHRSQKRKQKDLVRQQKVINILKPKMFWRYNAIDKTFKNVMDERNG